MVTKSRPPDRPTREQTLPRWADALLRRLARPGRAEDLIGDLAEAHRRRRERHGPLLARLLSGLEALELAAALTMERMRGGGEAKAGAAAPQTERKGGRMMRELPGILGYGLRTLRRSPLYVVLATLTLAAGVGANTAIFSVASWALLRPLPGVERPSELLSVRVRRGEGIMPFSHATGQRLLGAGAAVVNGAVYNGLAVDLMISADASPVRVQGQVVSAGYFATLGIEPYRGRFFAEAESGPLVAASVAVVSYGLWRQALSGDPQVVGRRLTLNGRPFTVVGVAPRAFGGLDRNIDVSIWVPASAFPVLVPRLPRNVLQLERAPVWSSLVLRGVAGADEAAIARELTAAAPELDRAGGTLEVNSRVGLSPGLHERLTQTLVMLGGLVALLLLLTAANLVNLVLSRASRRRQEVVVRRALGATPRRITSEVAAEGLILGLLGSAAAVGVSVLVLRVLAGPGAVAGVGSLEATPLDGRVLGFALITALLATTLASMLAAGALQRFGTAGVLRQQLGGSVAAKRLRMTLVSVQIALSLALVVGAGLSARSLRSLLSHGLGYSTEHAYVFSLNPGAQGYSDADSDRLFRDVQSALAAMPEVEAAGFTWLAPLGTQRYAEEVQALGGTGAEEAITSQANMISPDYFSAMGMELVAGRAFSGEEFERAERPDRGQVVLNETLARALFPDGRAVGRQLRMPGRRESAFDVIGVVRDARLVSAKEPDGPYLFDPFGNGYRTTSATFVIRSRVSEGIIADRVRTLVRARDPRLPLLDAGPLGGVVDRALAEEHALARLTSFFATLALLLASVGLLGLVSETVQARVREFGLRTALGARARDITLLVLRETALMFAFGFIPGVIASVQVGMLLESRLFGVGPVDAVTFAAASVLLGASAFAAALGPALRGARADPRRALAGE